VHSLRVITDIVPFVWLGFKFAMQSTDSKLGYITYSFRYFKQFNSAIHPSGVGK